LRAVGDAECPPALLDVLRRLGVDLDLRVVDAAESWARTCRLGETRLVRVLVDGRVAGDVRLPCLHEVRAPPRGYNLKVQGLSLGEHEVEAVDLARGIKGHLRVTIPALEVTADGRGIVAGAHATISVEETTVQVYAPSVLEPRGL
jgi:hypothetical protein